MKMDSNPTPVDSSVEGDLVTLPNVQSLVSHHFQMTSPLKLFRLMSSKFHMQPQKSSYIRAVVGSRDGPE